MFNPESPPELETSHWLNTNEPLSLAKLKGRVVVLAAFQMNCKGCQVHLLPQAARLTSAFNDDEIAVVGLHSVFEDHAAQSPEKLEDFIDAKGLKFPVAIDKPNGGDLPRTMATYEIQGTPTLLIFDRQGRLRRHYLGQVDDMRLAAEVMALSMESPTAPREQSIAIEQRLAMALLDPDDHHHHDHDHGGGCCGGGHDHHDHDHHHQHQHQHQHQHHDHEGGCCGGGVCGGGGKGGKA